QARNAMALTLKTMAEPTAIVAMHQVPGWSTGLLRHGHSDDRGGLESFRYLLQNDPHKAPLKVLYRLPSDDADTIATGLLLARPEAPNYAPPPDWLQQLQTYLDQPTDKQRCVLVTALHQAGFDAGNIRQIAHLGTP